jgi:uncharacterized protein YdaU (DUF1376 family)
MSQPFLPLFFGDLLASTPTWRGEERALYVLLLAYEWTSGPLPCDEDLLAVMSQFDKRTFKKLWSVVGRKFVETDKGLINPRLEEHRQKSLDIAAKRAAAGANGAAKRWQENGKRDSKPIANAIDLSCHPSHPISESKSGFAACADDPRKKIFEIGKTILGANSGSLISRAIKQTDEATVGAVLGEMSMKATADPRAYFVAATKPKVRGVVV